VQKIEEKHFDERDIVDNANYLVNIMEMNFNKCYKIAQKYPGLSKEELLNLYIENPNI
jgi:hypothetical protein